MVQMQRVDMTEVTEHGTWYEKVPWYCFRFHNLCSVLSTTSKWNPRLSAENACLIGSRSPDEGHLLGAFLVKTQYGLMVPLHVVWIDSSYKTYSMRYPNLALSWSYDYSRFRVNLFLVASSVCFRNAEAGHRQLWKFFASDFNVSQTYGIHSVLWLKAHSEIMQY